MTTNPSATPTHGTAAKIAIAERRRKALDMKLSGYTYAVIAEELGVSESVIKKDIQRSLDMYVDEHKESTERVRAAELAVLNDAMIVARRIMHEQHFAHSGGKIIERNIGTFDEPEYVVVIDNGPSMQAIDRVVKISESRRKLLGTDAPVEVRATVDGTINYVISVSADELEQL